MQNSIKFYALLAAIAFGLNWLWEMAQMFAFEIKPEDGLGKIFLFCTLAAVIDALVTIGIYVLLMKFNLANRKVFYPLTILLGAICAVGFELFALRFELWSYNRTMPVVPFLEVGLLPLIQLTTFVPLAIWLANRIVCRPVGSLKI
ncbi:MAG: hypothetical protein ABJA66_11105 [Actinomycetota bacterium]